MELSGTDALKVYGAYQTICLRFQAINQRAILWTRYSFFFSFVDSFFVVVSSSCVVPSCGVLFDSSPTIPFLLL